MKFYKEYKNLKVLITGTSGFKGAWLSFWLKKLGAKVTGLSLKPKNDERLFKLLNLDKLINQKYLNIKDYKRTEHVIRNSKPDIIFHLAAQSLVSEGYKNPIDTIETNIIGSANILELTKKYNIQALVYVNSDKCYFNENKNKVFKETDRLGGFDNYSASKASAELIFHSYFNSYFQNSKINIASARSGNVIGGGDFKKNRIIPDLVLSIKNNKKINLRNPKATRPWQHVMDPLSGYLNLGLKLLNKKIPQGTYPSWNFGPKLNNTKNVMNLTKEFLKIWGIKRNIQIMKKGLFHETKYLKINISKARKQLNWSPKLNFRKSLKLTVDWYKNSTNSKIANKIIQEQLEEFY